MAEGSAWIDGRVVPLSEARVPVTDRGFLFADSVFDTVRTYRGQPFLLGDHLDRLRASAATLFLPVPWPDSFLHEAVHATLATRGFVGEASVRIVVTRGDGGSGLSFPDPQVPRLVVLCRPTPTAYEGLAAVGVELVRPVDHVGKGGVPGHVKSGNYLGNVLALHEGQRAGGMESLMRGPDGSWGEATTSNLFAVQGGALVTPGPAAGVLPGITRALVLAVARDAGLDVAERSLFDGDLEAADELFITSSLKEVLPATALDGAVVGDGAPGPVTRHLQVLVDAAIQRIVAQAHARLTEAFPG